MSEAEKLPQNRPAETQVYGVPRYARAITALLDRGLVMTGVRQLRGKQLAKLGDTLDAPET